MDPITLTLLAAVIAVGAVALHRRRRGFGSRPGQVERRHPGDGGRAPGMERRKDDDVGGED